MNNYEKIKNMSVDEMAEIFNRKYCEECAYKEMNFDNWKTCDVNCWANIKNEYYKNGYWRSAKNELPHIYS